MKLKNIALGSAAALAMISTTLTTANAAVVDRPTFRVGGLVVVWGSDGTAGTDVVSDFYLLSPTASTAGTDLITGDVDGDADTVVTGDLASLTVTGTNPDGDQDGILEASETLAAFGVDATTDVDAGGATSHAGRFYVASNTGFQIRATASEVTNTMDGVDLSNILFDMDLETSGTTASGLAFGGATAQDPTGAAAGFAAAVTDLDDLDPTTPVTVFTGDQRTAAAVGTLAGQSVRFNTSYSLDADGDATADTAVDLSVGTGTLEAEVVYTIFTP